MEKPSSYQARTKLFWGPDNLEITEHCHGFVQEKSSKSSVCWYNERRKMQNNRCRLCRGTQEVQQGKGRLIAQVKHNILSFMIENLCKMGTCGRSCVVIFSTVRGKLSQERGSIVNVLMVNRD